MIHFQQRFAEAVADGTKRQTIRKVRKRPIKPGDRLVLATWTDKPYRSKVRLLREVVCTEVCKITIGDLGGRIDIDGRRIEWPERCALARDDGFTDSLEMLKWFEEVHGLPFSGVIIRW